MITRDQFLNSVNDSALSLRLHPRTVLLTTEMVRAVRGTDADTVTHEVDTGKLSWVWNVAVLPGDVRELRFLAREIITPSNCRFSVSHALDLIAGDRGRYRSPEICQLLFVSRPTLNRLFDAGELKYEGTRRKRWVTRADLADFLVRRLEGAAARRKKLIARHKRPVPNLLSLRSKRPA